MADSGFWIGRRLDVIWAGNLVEVETDPAGSVRSTLKVCRLIILGVFGSPYGMVAVNRLIHGFAADDKTIGIIFEFAQEQMQTKNVGELPVLASKETAHARRDLLSVAVCSKNEFFGRR